MVLPTTVAFVNIVRPLLNFGNKIWPKGDRVLDKHQGDAAIKSGHGREARMHCLLIGRCWLLAALSCAVA
jgi:hypothetical protein